jgi:hypothetical protein
MEDAEHAVEGAINLLDAFMVEGFRDDARHAGVDDGSGAAGLADQDVSYEFRHESKRVGERTVRGEGGGPPPGLANPIFIVCVTGLNRRDFRVIKRCRSGEKCRFFRR